MPISKQKGISVVKQLDLVFINETNRETIPEQQHFEEWVRAALSNRRNSA